MALTNCQKCGHQYSELKHNDGCPKCLPKKEKPNFTAALITGVSTLILFIGCQQLTKQTPEQVATERCFLEAALAAKAGGNKSFRFAKEISPTRAELVFSRNGATWSTNYFCES